MTSESATTIAVDMLATYRLTRLLQEDSLPPVQELRESLLERLEGRSAAELLTCPWCASPWIAALVLSARHLSPRLWSAFALILASSAVTGIISSAVE